jgi:hypothetical protein
MSKYQLQLLAEIADLTRCIRGATDYAAGVYLGDLRQVLREYWMTIGEDCR